MSILDWAKREVEIACKREREKCAATEDEWDYGCACYESALKAFNSLMEDGHSGTSISITKHILMRLIDGKPLTPIQDTDDVWEYRYTTEDGFVSYQCKRMSSLFKRVHPDGSVSYGDINRFYCVDFDNPHVSYHIGFIANIFDDMFPITMPYTPPTTPTKIVCETFLFDPKNGDYDTKAVLYFVDSNGKKVEINRYFKEIGDDFIEIDKDEYDHRRMIAQGWKETME